MRFGDPPITVRSAFIIARKGGTPPEPANIHINMIRGHIKKGCFSFLSQYQDHDVFINYRSLFIIRRDNACVCMNCLIICFFIIYKE